MACDVGETGLKELKYLSLVSKVCTELETNLGFGDKVLAEFVIELGKNCVSVDEFFSKLKENGAEMPDYIVRTLLTIIHAILPPKQGNQVVKDGEGSSGKSSFPGLNISDGKERVREVEREIEFEAEERRCGKGEEECTYRDGDRGRDRDGYRGRRDERRREDRYGGRERRGKYRDRDVGDERRDYRGKEREWDGYEKDGEKRCDGEIKSVEPELYKIYKGRVSRVMDSGCFVRFNDFRDKEGLVHVSQIATRRISNAKEVVKRDQEVYVKVISISGHKLSLSMRDVDQNTGDDLLPLKRSSVEEDVLRANPWGLNKGSTSRTGLSGIRITEEDDAGTSRRAFEANEFT